VPLPLLPLLGVAAKEVASELGGDILFDSIFSGDGDSEREAIEEPGSDAMVDKILGAAIVKSIDKRVGDNLVEAEKLNKYVNDKDWYKAADAHEGFMDLFDDKRIPTKEMSEVQLRKHANYLDNMEKGLEKLYKERRLSKSFFRTSVLKLKDGRRQIKERYDVFRGTTVNRVTDQRGPTRDRGRRQSIGKHETGFIELLPEKKKASFIDEVLSNRKMKNMLKLLK